MILLTFLLWVARVTPTTHPTNRVVAEVGHASLKKCVRSVINRNATTNGSLKYLFSSVSLKCAYSVVLH